MDPFPENERTFKIKASKFKIIKNILFSKSTVGPYLTYIDKNEAKIVLKETHKGECGNHTQGRHSSLRY